MMNKFIRFWIPVLGWAVVIFLFSSEALPPTSKIYWRDFIVKKSAHLIEYAVFATLLFRGFINSGVQRKRAVIYTLLASMLYGATDEFHQSFTPGGNRASGIGYLIQLGRLLHPTIYGDYYRKRRRD